MNEPVRRLPINEPPISRRRLLEMSGMGLGSVALAAMLHREGLHGSEGPARERKAQPLDLTPKPTHFPPAAKAVIQLVMTGGPSQMDMFDPKPTLQRRHGERYKIQIDQFQSGSEPNKLLEIPLEIVEVTPRAQVEYAPDHPMFAGGELGKCNPGA